MNSIGGSEEINTIQRRDARLNKAVIVIISKLMHTVQAAIQTMQVNK